MSTPDPPWLVRAMQNASARQPPPISLPAAMQNAVATAPPTPPPAPVDPTQPPPSWGEADALAGAAAGMPPPQGPPSLQIPARPLYAPVIPPGQITASPREATAGLLSVNKDQEAAEKAAGDANAKAYAEAQAAEQDEAQRKEAEAQSERTAQAYSQQKVNEAHQRHLDAFSDYTKKAGTLKDPHEQFWEDKGTGARVLSGLAAFASGFGAGLTGQGGNPYLEYLNKQIEGNYQAHKANVDALFDKQVAAGKIEDTVENRAEFDRRARFAHYDLASQVIGHKLKGIANGALGQNVKALTNRTLSDLDKQNIAYMQALSQQEAQALQAKYAAQAAAREAAWKKYMEATKTAPEAASPQERAERTQATLAGAPPGAYPVPALKTLTDVAASGGLSTQPYSKAEDRQKIKERMYKGRVFNTKEEAEAAGVMDNATNAVEGHLNQIERIEKELASGSGNGNELRGEYEREVADLSQQISAAEMATKRVPGAKSFAAEGMPEPPSTVGATVGIYAAPRIAANKGRIKALREIIKTNREGVANFLEDKPLAPAPDAKPKKVSVADLPDAR